MDRSEEIAEKNTVATVTQPRRKQQVKPSAQTERKRQPRYNVILWDDDDHSYNYVIDMMQSLFGHTIEKSFEIAVQVDRHGSAVCLTTTMEHAELKRDQIHAFGKDKLIATSVGAMKSTIAPIDC